MAAEGCQGGHLASELLADALSTDEECETCQRDIFSDARTLYELQLTNSRYGVSLALERQL